MDYATAAATGMAKQTYAAQAASNALTRPELLSESILNRLSSIKHAVKELSASADSAADKIVGPVPSAINGTAESSKLGEPPQPSHFLASLSRLVSEIERVVEVDLRQNINRLHSEF